MESPSVFSRKLPSSDPLARLIVFAPAEVVMLSLKSWIGCNPPVTCRLIRPPARGR